MKTPRKLAVNESHGRKTGSRRRTPQRKLKSKSKSKSRTRLPLRGGGELVQIDTNDDFLELNNEFVRIFLENPDALYDGRDVRAGKPSNWRFGPLVTDRFTPRNRRKLNRALAEMFPTPSRGSRPVIDPAVLEEYGPLATWDTHLIDDMSFLGKQIHHDMDGTWPYDISNWDMKNVTTMRGMFSKCTQLQRVDCSRWDTGSVEDMSRMFMGCTRLEGLDFTNQDSRGSVDSTSKRVRVSPLFLPFDVTHVKTMRRMFQGCSNLRSLDLSSWNTRQVDDTSSMFADCVQLQTLQYGMPHGNFIFNDANVRSMFWRVPSDAKVTILGFNPWQCYLSTLDPVSATPPHPHPGITHTSLVTRPPGVVGTNRSWFGPSTQLVFQWQHLNVAEVYEMIRSDRRESDLKWRQLEAAIDYLGSSALPSLPCTANCTAPARKEWRDFLTVMEHGGFRFIPGAYDVNDSRTPDEQRCVDANKAHDENRFQSFIATQNSNTTTGSGGSTSSPTVLVMAQLHGGYDDCDIMASPPLPMFTIPHGKSLIIVSLATPGAAWFPLLKLEKELLSDLHGNLQDPSYRSTMDRDPVIIAKQVLEHGKTHKKKATDTLLVRSLNPPPSYLQQGLEYHEDVLHFLSTSDEPRLLYFKEWDNCADKTFSLDEDFKFKLISVRENVGDDADRNLFPPNTTHFTLSQLCYQMFIVSGHSNVILVDSSCSPFLSVDGCPLPPAYRDSLAESVLRQRFGGGYRRTPRTMTK